MKQIFLIPLLGLCFISQVSAQQKDSIIILPEIRVTASSKVNVEVTNAFKKAFPDAVYIRWFRLNKAYLTKFIKEDMTHQALFGKKGYLIYDIRFGYEDNLPSAALKLVRDNYDKYLITRAINVRESGRNIWVVNLKNLQDYVIVRIEDDELEEVERFQRAD